MISRILQDRRFGLTATGFALLLAVAGCGASEEDVRAVSTAASSAVLAAEINEEANKSQDFDKIASDTVAGMDTSGLSSLQ
ncbi:hypothetical protein PSA7680_00692 [Pseudoruegeria aquimaris]|uniref:Uncharacterized protein n=1 Tax=Pseudoruegeria aquimaris TaxID=393663 RepID=A0A1Y5RKC7_9RHOB|nr:hypothetical protein [Pseudoruegeria aquimaris]SLN19282.1 hypothetical protein PSA7680_00692 [Pseudoruegeria aquimaris]